MRRACGGRQPAGEVRRWRPSAQLGHRDGRGLGAELPPAQKVGALGEDAHLCHIGPGPSSGGRHVHTSALSEHSNHGITSTEKSTGAWLLKSGTPTSACLACSALLLPCHDPADTCNSSSPVSAHRDMWLCVRGTHRASIRPRRRDRVTLIRRGHSETNVTTVWWPTTTAPWSASPSVRSWRSEGSRGPTATCCGSGSTSGGPDAAWAGASSRPSWAVSSRPERA